LSEFKFLPHSIQVNKNVLDLSLHVLTVESVMNEKINIEGLITKVEYLTHPKAGPYAKLSVEGQETISVIVKGPQEKDGTPFLSSYGQFLGVMKNESLVADDDWIIDPNVLEDTSNLTMPSNEIFEKDNRIANLRGIFSECLEAAKLIDDKNQVAIAIAIFNKY